MARTASPLQAVAQLPSYHRGAPVIASIIRSVCDDADASAGVPAHPAFRGDPVLVTKFLARLIEHGEASPGTLIGMFILIDRWAKRNALTKQCVHRVMSAAFIVAAFAMDDYFLPFCDYERICRIDGAVLKDLVYEFLGAIQLDVSVSPSDFARVESLLLKNQRN